MENSHRSKTTMEGSAFDDDGRAIGVFLKASATSHLLPWSSNNTSR
jgi:hypothetical protein